MRKYIVAGISIAAMAGGTSLVATPAGAAEDLCEYAKLTYERLYLEGNAANDIVMLSKAGYWVQEYQQCVEKRAAEQAQSSGSSSTSGSSSSSASTFTTPTFQSTLPYCGGLKQPIPQGRQVSDSEAVFTWDATPGAAEYQFISARYTPAGGWSPWGQFASVGKQTSVKLPLHSGETLAVSVISHCLWDGTGPKITGTAYVDQKATEFQAPSLPADWYCTGVASDSSTNCSKVSVISKKASKSALTAIEAARTKTVAELSSLGADTQKSEVRAERGAGGILRVTYSADIAKKRIEYATGRFVAAQST